MFLYILPLQKKLRTSISSDLTQNDMLGADDQQVAFKLPAYFLLDAVVHVWGVVWIELVDEDLLGQLDGKAVSIDGDLLHELTTLDPHWGEEKNWDKWERVVMKGGWGRFNYLASCWISLPLVFFLQIFLPRWCEEIKDCHLSFK